MREIDCGAFGLQIFVRAVHRCEFLAKFTPVVAKDYESSALLQSMNVRGTDLNFPPHECACKMGCCEFCTPLTDTSLHLPCIVANDKTSSGNTCKMQTCINKRCRCVQQLLQNANLSNRISLIVALLTHTLNVDWRIYKLPCNGLHSRLGEKSPSGIMPHVRLV